MSSVKYVEAALWSTSGILTQSISFKINYFSAIVFFYQETACKMSMGLYGNNAENLHGLLDIQR